MSSSILCFRVIVRNKKQAKVEVTLAVIHLSLLRTCSVYLFGYVWRASGSGTVKTWKEVHVLITQEAQLLADSVLLPSKCLCLVWCLPRSLVSHRCPPATGQSWLEKHLSGEPPKPFLEWQSHTELPAKPGLFFQPLKCLWLHLEPRRTNSVSERLLIYSRLSIQSLVTADGILCVFSNISECLFGTFWRRWPNHVPSFFLHFTYTLTVNSILQNDHFTTLGAVSLVPNRRWDNSQLTVIWAFKS